MDIYNNPIAPIIVFVYNRPEHARSTLKAIAKNELASQSVLFIYADGPKSNATQEQIQKINKTREVIRKQQWCKEVYIIESDHNKGLAKSIISGVTEIVNNYGKVIVLEDDIVTSRGFLTYMNEALELYEKDEKVMHVSGYMYPHHKNLPETFFFNVPLCWGWATWSRAWKYFISDSKHLFDHFEKSGSWKQFNAFGGKVLQRQLERNIDGRLNTWFVKWHASVMIREGLTLYPRKSLIENIGYDSTGMHGEMSEAYKDEIVEQISVHRQKIVLSKKAAKIIEGFYIGRSSGKEDYKKVVRSIIPLSMRNGIRNFIFRFTKLFLPEISKLRQEVSWEAISSSQVHCRIAEKARLYGPHRLHHVSIGEYTYVAQHAVISYTTIGKFCSIGPNFLCGYGIHPVNGISTSPVFYSTMKQAGITFSAVDKIEERKFITIGNDVFIGANVTVLDGVTIGDGAVIGAGAVVSKDIPPYAIAVGVPIQIIKYRFSDDQISKLLKIKWWEFDENKLKDVEKMFFEVDAFIKNYERT